MKVPPPVPRTETFAERLDFVRGSLRFYSETDKADLDEARRTGAAATRASGLIIRPDRCEVLQCPRTQRRRSGR